MDVPEVKQQRHTARNPKSHLKKNEKGIRCRSLVKWSLGPTFIVNAVVQCSENSPYNSTQNISDYRVKNKESILLCTNMLYIHTHDFVQQLKDILLHKGTLCSALLLWIWADRGMHGLWLLLAQQPSSIPDNSPPVLA